MKINKLKINAFGNIENKEIELSENINILYGKNEAGKSTLLKFIVDSFYGISKNKRGKEISDYDRYKPWNKEEFSGKLTYTLDNGKTYEVFRDFNKKNPKIYDEELKDISKEFTIDKTYGNRFFTEQTKIEEDTFLSTLVSMQQEVKLGKQEQNSLLQKIANLAGTGQDNVSYQKAMEKINKRQIEEIGTSRSQGRPINVVKEEKFKLQDEIGELEEYKEKQYEIEELKQKLEKEIKQEEEKLALLKELKRLEEIEKIEKQKIALNKNIISENREKIETLKLEKDELQKKKSEIEIPEERTKKEKKQNRGNRINIAILIIGLILAIIFYKSIVLFISFAMIGILSLVIFILTKIKNRSKQLAKNKEKQEQIQKANRQKQELQSEIDKITSQIELLIKNKEEQTKTIENSENLLRIQIEKQKQEIVKKYQVEGINDIPNTYELENIQNNINDHKLASHSLELDKNNILPKLEKLAEREEELEELEEKEQNLLKLNQAMELAKQVLEIAYRKMKENVTPRFTQNLSQNIEQISNGKYKNVKINDEEGILVEKESGEYISSERLSIRYNRPIIFILKIRCNKRII